jgi:NitT/TauT family transport system substrate-binding protein
MFQFPTARGTFLETLIEQTVRRETAGHNGRTEMKFQPKLTLRGLTMGVAAAAFAVVSAGAGAAEKVRAIDSTKTPFDHFALHQAKDQGFFKEEGLDVSVIFGDGGASTLQALITANQDVAVGVGVLAVIGAYAKGAPLKIIGNTFRGADNVIWYVPKDSPIKSFKDLDGKQMAFSRPGSTTHLAAQYIMRELGIKPKLVSTGGMSASRTQVMSGQVDTGWTAAPTNLNLIREGKARIIGTGKEAGELSQVTIRVVAANSNWLAKNRATAKKFIAGLGKGREYNYTDAGVAAYAKRWNIELEDARRAPEFAPKDTTEINTIFGFEKLVKLAYELKYIKEPLPMDKAKGMLDLVGK